MALGIYQVTYSDREFCRSVGLSVLSRFCYFRHLQVSKDDEIWQAYQEPDQIKLEIVVYLIRPYGGGGVRGRLNRKN